MIRTPYVPLQPAHWKGRVAGCLAGIVKALALASIALLAVQAMAEPPTTPASLSSNLASADRLLKNWTNFRGPGAIGHAPRANPPLKWNTNAGGNMLWKVKLPKPGMSSPIVWENRLFLTGADDSARQLYCFETGTGKLLWTHDVDALPGAPSDGTLPDVLDETGYAAPTATTDGRFVAAIFGTGELVCVNLSGERVWAKHLGTPANHYGHASSLISHGSLLFVQLDQKANSKLLAFNLASGKPAWEVKRGAISWSSPILINNRGRPELILSNSKGVAGYDPETGKLLWQVECLDGEVATSAAYADGLVFVASEGATAAAIDIANHNPAPKILWRWDNALPDTASPVADESRLIVPTAFGAVNCLNAKTGKVFWEHEFSKGFNSSPILVKDRVYLTDRSGTLQVFRMADTFELLASSNTGEEIHATPAFVGDKLFIRGMTHLFCIAEHK